MTRRKEQSPPARPKTGRVPLTLVTRRDECQPRAAGLDEDTVGEYVAALDRGEELPPLSVVSVLDTGVEAYVLVDGYHRLAAHERRRARKPGVTRRVQIVEVAEGDLSVAVWHAAAANRGHGLRRTPEDLALAIARARQSRPAASDREIARHLGCSPTTVARRQPEVSTLSTVDTLDTALEADPDASDRAIARAVGVAPTTVGARRRALAQISPAAVSLPGQASGSPDLAPPEDAEPSSSADAGALPTPVTPEAATSTLEAFVSSAHEEADSILRPLTEAIRAASAAKRAGGHLARAAADAGPKLRAVVGAIRGVLPVVHERCGGAGCERCHGQGWTRARSVDHA